MALRRGHGTGASSPLRVEVPPPDELTNADVAAPAAAIHGPVPRRPDGKVDGKEAARELGRRGGLARAARRARAEAFAGKLRLAADLPMFEPSAHALPFSEEAEAFFQAKVAELANDSDGQVSSGVASIVRSAAWQTYSGRLLMELATSRNFLFVKGREARPEVNATLMLQASRLFESGRQSLLAAHHVQQLEAKARLRALVQKNPEQAATAQLAAFYEAAEDAEKAIEDLKADAGGDA